MPSFVLDPARSPRAYAPLVETGLRLHSLAGAMRLRSLTKELSRQLELIRVLEMPLTAECFCIYSDQE